MTALEEEIKARIRREGPLRFDDYMAACLAEYYGRGPAIGPDGDFATSVRFPAFREAIARLVRRAGVARVVELGAGTSELARAVISTVPGIEYWTVDTSPALRARQADAGARAVASVEQIPASTSPCLVFGNEVLDALPVRRIAGGPKGLLEVYVDVVEGAPSTSRRADGRVDLEGSGRLRDRLLPCPDEFPGVRPARGQICDVAPGLPAFVRAAARLADPGFLLFIDYGDVAERLYAQTRINGTLAAYRAHGRNHDWYANVGEQDLTADVDWSAVARAAVDAGMEELGLVSQQELLEALEVTDFELTSPARLGSAFQAFAARRGMSGTLPGF